MFFICSAVFICTVSSFTSVCCFFYPHRNKSVRYSSAVSLSFVLWSFGALLIQIVPKNFVWYCYNLSAIGFISLTFTVPFYVFSLLNQTSGISERFKNTVQILLGITTLIMSVIQVVHPLFVIDFIYSDIGVVEVVNRNSVGFFISYFLLTFVSLFCLALLIAERINNKTRKFNTFFIFLSLAIIILILIYSVFRLVSPIISLTKNFPNFFYASYLGVLPSIILLLWHNKQTELTLVTLVRESMEFIPEMSLVAYNNGELYANSKFCDNFNFTQGITIEQFTETHPRALSIFNRYLTLANVAKDKMVELHSDKNQSILVDISSVPIKDKYGDILATLFMLQQMYDYERIMNTYKLSPQEKRLVLLAANGSSNKEIAISMNLSENTVRNYLTNIYQKTETTNRVELIQLVFPSKH